ncbi:MAG: DPP IV N-terminal domain-containing protein [Flavobacteriales bacterium]
MRYSLLLVTALFLSCAGFSQQRLTLEEAVTGQFRQFAPSTIQQLQWVPGADLYSYVKDETLWIGAVKQGNPDKKILGLPELNTFMGNADMKRFPAIKWLSIERFSFEEKNAYWEVDMKLKKAQKVSYYPEQAANADFHSKSRRTAYTKDNNLYITFNQKEITVTKEPAYMVCGQSISRNEYGISKGTFWSPDGGKLAYYIKNESNVTDYPLVDFTVTPAATKTIKYPMAGGKSEIVYVGVYDVATAQTVRLKMGRLPENDQYYMTNLTWSPDGKTIYVAWLNRATTDMRFISFDASTGMEVATLFSEHDDKWVEPQFPAYFLPNNANQFLWISQRDGFNNLYLYDTKGTLLRQTKAKYDITEFLGFDFDGKHAFVMATGENPTESRAYKVHLNDFTMTEMTTIAGTHNVQVSENGMFIIDQYSNLSVPNTINLVTTEGRMIRNLHTATNPYAGKSIGKTELFTVPGPDGTSLWCRLIKPSNFDATKKYPVVVYVYGGPHAQMNTNSWLGGASLWMNQLAEEGYLVFTLDNRGSANRGKNFQQVIHRQLGTAEMQDQLAGVEWLKKQPFVDASRMAVHGWSFGGFMTTSLMLKSPEIFKVGVAGGPVIDWSMYEVMYGERYMDTPQENPQGYQASNLTNHVKNLKGKLLMIHGMDDDVVVMQHNVNFLKACVDNKVQVDFFAYPGHAHNVRGKDRVHLITKIVEYIKTNL